MAGFDAALPGRRYPIADANGVINQPWYDFFQNFFNRTGGSATDKIDGAESLALTLLDSGEGDDDRLRRGLNDAAARIAEIDRPDYDSLRRRVRDLETLIAGIDTGGGAVLSVFGRTGAVIAKSGDYAATQLSDYTAPANFTPVLTFGGGSTGITYSAQVGRSIRIGKFALAEIYLLLTAKGSSTGLANITGLPFTAENNASQFVAVNFSYAASMSYTGQIGGHVNANGTAIIIDLINNGVRSVAADTNFTNTSEIIVSVCFITT